MRVTVFNVFAKKKEVFFLRKGELPSLLSYLAYMKSSQSAYLLRRFNYTVLSLDDMFKDQTVWDLMFPSVQNSNVTFNATCTSAR